MKIVLWDTHRKPVEFSENTVLLAWNPTDQNITKKALSIINFIETNSDLLKNKYLTWVSRFPAIEVGGTRVETWLELEKNISFWPMTLIAEKSNIWKSQDIHEIIKLFALELLLEKHRACQQIIVYSDDYRLITCVKSLCLKKKLSLEIEHGPSYVFNKVFTNFGLNELTVFARGVFAYCRAITRFNSKGHTNSEKWLASDSAVIFFSQVTGDITSSPEAVTYGSTYWGNLPQLCDRKSIRTRWVHLFAANSSMSIPGIRESIQRVNRNSNSQSHVLLEDFFRLGVYVQVICKLIKLWKIQARLRSTLSSLFYFWPCMKSEWTRSFCGPSAVQNLLYFYAVKALFKRLPPQRLLAYTQENQGWEAALLQCLNTSTHGEVLAFPHATIRYWDLRYHAQCAGAEYKSNYQGLFPIIQAIPGPGIASQLCSSGSGSRRYVEVESLRYIDHRGQSSVTDKGIRIARGRLLVLGDYGKKNTLDVLYVLTAALAISTYSGDVIFKPHPLCKWGGDRWLRKNNIERTSRPLIEELSLCDTVLAAASTTSALEAYEQGRRTMIFCSKASLNISPLRGVRDILLISEVKELAVELSRDYRIQKPPEDRQPYFYRDPSLPKWSMFLDEVLGL